MSQNQVKNLQEKLACQDEEICDLRERLSTYDKDMAEKDALQKRLDDLQRWIKEAEKDMNRTNDEQSTIIESQSKKLKKLELAITALQASNRKLSDINECQAEQLKNLQWNEQKLVAEIEKLEASKKKLEYELCNVKNQLHETNSTVEKLTIQLQAKQEELQCVRKKLEECQTAVNQLRDRCNKLETDVASANAKLEECQAAGCRLRERCRDLEADLECARAKLEDAKTRAAATETRLKAQADALAEELECRARKLREVEAECDEWKGRAAEQQCKANKLNALAAELRATADRERADAEAREQRLKRDVCERAEEVRRRDEQLEAARQENEDATCAVTALKTRVQATECLLENARRSAEDRDRAQDEVRERLEHDKVGLSREVQRKTAEVAELERQVCRLRDELRRAGDDRGQCCDVRGGGSRPSCSPPRRSRPVADDRSSSVITDDSFISTLKRLYCDLELHSKFKSRRNN